MFKPCITARMSFPLSDHCNGKTFFNPGQRAERGLLGLLRWKLTSRASPWPRWVELAPSAPPPPAGEGEIVATWINHATFLLQTPSGNFLTDPVFSERTSPVSWAGPRRVHAPGVAFDDLPKIDGVLLSHDHYDHCDLPTLQRLASTHQPLVLAPLGHRALLAAAGITRVVDLDWWQTHAWTPGISVTLTPARHWCRRRAGGTNHRLWAPRIHPKHTPISCRRAGGTNHRLWGGFFLRSGAQSAYFVGDSGYDAALFPLISERLGAPDLALIPIGAYEPRWFMRSAHMNPAESVQVHRDLGAKVSVGMHWGCWRLTDEGRDDPPRALAEARQAAGIAEADFRILTPGESVTCGNRTGSR